MFRKALAMSIVAMGMAGVANAQDLDSGRRPAVRPSYRQFQIVYRPCARDPWRFYAVTPSHDRAHDIVRRLERQGYDARVVHGR